MKLGVRKSPPKWEIQWGNFPPRIVYFELSTGGPRIWGDIGGEGFDLGAIMEEIVKLCFEEGKRAGIEAVRSVSTP